MDVLTDILRLHHLRASVFFQSDFAGDWSVDSSGSGKATFHLIARGSCWLHLPDQSEAITLQGGDLVVFPRDSVHAITSSPEPPDLHAHSGIQQSGEKGNPASLICGYFEFNTPIVNPILEALPDAMHIPAEDPANAEWLDMLMRFITVESKNDEPGSAVVIDKLSDVLFIQVVRTHIRRHGCTHGILAALADRRISRVLQQIHQHPGKNWTVARLAESIGLSRSVFAKRFQEVMDMPPMTYVTRWRMQRAWQRLQEGKESVLAIAEESGYRTEAAFRKAFKQHMGMGPGAVRKLGSG